MRNRGSKAAKGVLVDGCTQAPCQNLGSLAVAETTGIIGNDRVGFGIVVRLRPE